MTDEPWTQAEYDAARAAGWAPWGSEKVWREVRRSVRRCVDEAPPLPPEVHAELRAILGPRRFV